MDPLLVKWLSSLSVRDGDHPTEGGVRRGVQVRRGPRRRRGLATAIPPPASLPLTCCSCRNLSRQRFVDRTEARGRKVCRRRWRSWAAHEEGRGWGRSAGLELDLVGVDVQRDREIGERERRRWLGRVRLLLSSLFFPTIW